MTTIQDVARAAGVAASTVSRYLNGQLKVSPATEAKVLEAVAELGYVPNAAGRNLARRRQRRHRLRGPGDQQPVLRHDRRPRGGGGRAARPPGAALLAPQPVGQAVQLHRPAGHRGHRRDAVPRVVPVQRAARGGDRRRPAGGRRRRADRRAAARAHRGDGRLRRRLPGHQLPGRPRPPENRLRLGPRRARLGHRAPAAATATRWPRAVSSPTSRSGCPASSPSSSA